MSSSKLLILLATAALTALYLRPAHERVIDIGDQRS
jgi:hypothetical protein